MPANSISSNPALAGGDRMQLDQLKRREFITLLGGAAVACTGRRSDQMISPFIRREPWVMWIVLT
jgi:hypothetical protein